MGTIIVVIIILIVVFVAVKSTIKRIRYGSACCGQRDKLEKKIKPADKNKSHYQYKYIASVDGMHCSNCIRRVENALNSVDGLWATASLENKSVTVLSKVELETAVLESRIREAGYTVLSVTSN